MATFVVRASNDQGAKSTLAQGKEFPSIDAAEKAARAELGDGWTVNIFEVIDKIGGERLGKSAVKTFSIRRL